MILTPHLLLGAAIASRISNPFLALPLAFLSHFLLDVLPHDDYSIENIKEKHWDKAFFDFLKVFGDIAFGFLLLYLFSGKEAIIFAGALAAIVPDGITLVSIIFPKNKLAALHQKAHMAVNTIGDSELNKKIPLWKATLSQIVAATTAIFILR